MSERRDEALGTPPMFNVPAVVAACVAGLILIHGALLLAGESWQVFAIYALSFIPARLTGDVPYPAIPGSGAWSFVTYALLHGSWMHVLLNSLWFMVFGTLVARRLGSLRFLLLCAVSAAGGAFAMLIIYWGKPIILIGASGAVSGLLGASIPLMYAPGAGFSGLRGADIAYTVPLRPLELLTNRRALVFTLIWFGLTLLSGASGGASGNSFADEPTIAWEAHIGGFLMGLACFYGLDMRQDLRSS